MDIRQLEFFVAVVETGSFSAAGKRCFVTQPAISSSIAKLESELGVPLLDRYPRRVELTDFGQALYESALDVIADVRQASTNIDALRQPEKGQVAIGIDQTIAANFITDIISDLLSDYPGMRVEVVTGLARQFEMDVLRGELDFVVAQPPLLEDRSDELLYEPLFQEAVFAVAAGGQSLACKTRIRAADFARQPWCALRWIHGRMLWMPEFFEMLEIPAPEPYVASNALSIMKSLLPSTGLIALFPERLVTDELASGRLVRLGGARFQFSTTRYLISRRGRYDSPARCIFRERLHKGAATF